MKKDGLSPIAFADKDGWPAMGTFDILNLRINGYDFHIQLMEGEASLEGPEGRQGLRHLARAAAVPPGGRARPHLAGGRAGRWPNKKAGMYLLGMFVGQQFTEGEAADDLDFFAFPEIDSNVGADTLDAPIDGFMLSKDPENEEGAKALLEYLAWPRGAEHLPGRRTRTTSPPPTTPTPAPTARCRRRPSS